MTTSPPVRPPRRRAPLERPTEILAAALEEFSARGFQAARLEDVAKRAGCSKAAIYLYYKDKTALFEAVVRNWLVSHLDAAREMITANRGSVVPILYALPLRTVTLVTEHPVPDIIRLVIGESRAFPHLARIWHDEVINQALPLITRLIAAGIANGEFRAVDPGYAARSLMAPLVFATLWRSVFEPIGAAPLDVAGFITSHVDLILGGLKIQGPEPNP
jgi:AcrR family transcriptional regulator